MQSRQNRLWRLVVAAMGMIVSSGCVHVDELRSTPEGGNIARVRFNNGDSIDVGRAALSTQGMRRQAVILSDGQVYSLDSVKSFRDELGRNFIVIGNKPFVQAASGRINVYSRHTISPADTGIVHAVKRLSPFDFVRKPPDDNLYNLTSGSLLRMTSDNPQAVALARSFRYYQRRSNVILATGATLAAAGAITAFIGAFTSDADANYRRPYFIAGAAGFGIGTGLLTIPLPYYASRAARARNAAINIYNQ